MDGNYIMNPGYAALKDSMLNMMVAGTESAVLMVESEANEMTEDEMLGGVLFATRNAGDHQRRYGACANRR